MRSKNPNAGFTLPEVLTAVVIVGLVLVTLYSCWAAVLGASQSSAIAVQDAQRERMAIRAISDALAGVSWYENRKEEPLRLDDLLGFSHLKLISRVPSGFWGERELANYPLRRIEFLTEDKPRAEDMKPAKKGRQLVMIQQALLAPTNSAKVHRTVLLPHVETFNIEVLPWPPFNSQSWQSSWPLTDDQIEDLVEKWKALKARPDANASTNDTDKLTDAANTLFETRGLPLQAKVTFGAVEAFPRKSTLPIFASQASHAKDPPGIGVIGSVNDVTFGEGGFDVDASDSDARVIFIIDKSGSMSGARLAMAKEAILSSLKQMEQGGEDVAKGKFYIYFFNRQSDAMPASAMLEATLDNIQRMSEWLNSQKAQGGTDPSDSIKSAFTHKPTELFLLTDGAFRTGRDEPTIRELMGSLNADKSVVAHTLALGEELRGRESETTLMLIAKENGGTYTFIDPSANSPDPTIPPPPAFKK